MKVKVKEDYLIYGVLAIVFVALIFSISSFVNFQKEAGGEATSKPSEVDTNKMGSRLSRMSLTGFDVMLAKQFMDKDGDGKCDACGMPVEMCIGSGQLQCNMDPQSTIGVLGSQHIHADWKAYIDGVAFDFEPFAMDMSKMDANATSSFIHVDKGAQPPEKTSDALHMHAKGVPLWLFFRSIGGDFNETCLTLPNNRQFCDSESKRLRFYVNGKPNSEFGDYVFNDLDKILISYGSAGADAQSELDSVTDFAKNH
ncbi:hypothetical protein HYY73_06495 [Candidatus Woesearchaeota archaeon]|nr:hypothetical protein [Candidatus Woesearchaeota archaeon]